VLSVQLKAIAKALDLTGMLVQLVLAMTVKKQVLPLALLVTSLVNMRATPYSFLAPRKQQWQKLQPQLLLQLWQ
jgi:predicted branched-subunit amino acid permease